MHPSRYFFIGCTAFCFGVFAAGFFSVPDAALVAALAMGVFGAVLFWGRPRRAALCIALAALALGASRETDVLGRWREGRERFFELGAAQRAKNAAGFMATVASHERTKNSALYTLENISIASSGDRWSLLAPEASAFRAGERVRIAGGVFDTATAGEAFLKRDGVAGTILFPKSVVSLGSPCAGPWSGFSCARYGVVNALARAKEIFEANLRGALPEPAASLADGLLLGSRTDLPQELKDDFKRTGLAHIVAVSGYNVSVLVLAVSTVLGFLFFSRRSAFWASAAFLCAFTLITGASASVVRASLMAFLVLLAQKTSRMYSARVAIAFAGAAMLLQNPLILRHDLGFVLSFLATAGLLTLFPLLQERAAKLPNVGGLKDIVLQSVAAQLFVLPVLLAAFGSLPVVFLASNAAVLPFIPATMLFSFAGGVAGFFGELFSRIVAFPAYVLLRWEIGAIRFFADIPHASFSVESAVLRWAGAACCAVFVAALLWRLKRSARTAWERDERFS